LVVPDRDVPVVLVIVISKAHVQSIVPTYVSLDSFAFVVVVSLVPVLVVLLVRMVLPVACA
jgi:hypothetical protein